MKKRILKLIDAQLITLSNEYLTNETYVLVYRSEDEHGFSVIDDYRPFSIRGLFYRLLM